MQTNITTAIAAKPVLFNLPQWFSELFGHGSAFVDAPDDRVDQVRALQRMARELEVSQPNLAAELRNFAARS